ncbi:MAG: hypothetical protein Q7S48_00960 [bacterium]|nr:hypothetical protein [bacterium]
MSEPIIHVIPEAYYAGASPRKISRVEAASSTTSPAASTASGRSSRNKWIFISVIAGSFLIVVAGSIWYFTKGLRPVAPTPSSTAPQVELPSPVVLPPVVSDPQVPVPPEPQIPSLPELSPSSDADADFLTETEETLYGSQPTVPDTDNDGFLDGHELVNLYNPSGIAPERLEATAFVTRFKHPIYFYELLYPKTWQLLPDSSARELSFQSTTGESIAVTVIDNPTHLTPRAFAVSSAPSATITDWTTNKSNASGVFIEETSPLQLRGVFGNENFLYVLHYVLPSQGSAVYRRTFEMMLNSFRTR